MPFPTTIEGLKEANYKFEGDGVCKGCGADIEWWTTPSQRKMPTNHGTATPHWGTCPNRQDFKKSDPAPTSKVTSATVNWDWLREQARSCHCTVCNKISGRS